MGIFTNGIQELIYKVGISSLTLSPTFILKCNLVTQKPEDIGLQLINLMTHL